MQGNYFAIAWYIDGTTAANKIFSWIAPIDLTLVQVTAVASNDSDAKLSLGTNANGDAYKLSAVIGDSLTPVEWTRGEFDGDSGHNTAECPVIPAGTLFNATLDYDGASGTAAQNVCIVFTFLQ